MWRLKWKKSTETKVFKFNTLVKIVAPSQHHNLNTHGWGTFNSLQSEHNRTSLQEEQSKVLFCRLEISILHWLVTELLGPPVCPFCTWASAAVTSLLAYSTRSKGNNGVINSASVLSWLPLQLVLRLVLTFSWHFANSYLLICAPTEERRAHAAIHPGSQHHHTLLCIMGLGGGDRLHCACPVHQHVWDESAERTAALPNPEGGRDPGL